MSLSFIENALNAACESIQKDLGVKDGGGAALFFTGDNYAAFDSLFCTYINFENCHSELHRLLTGAGFEVWDTGGGCECYGLYANGLDYRITSECGSALPENLDDILLVTIYGSFDARIDDFIVVANFKLLRVNLADFLESINNKK